MPYDSRLTINQKYSCPVKKTTLSNKLKIVEYVDFVQLYVNSGDMYGQIRLDVIAVQQLKEFLENVEIV